MTQTTTATEAAPSRRRTGNRTLWVLQCIAAIGFLSAAAGKLAGDHRMVATFHSLGWGDWVRYLLAGLELMGAVALLVPRLTGLAALAFVGLTVGAVTVQLATGGDVVMALVLLVISVIVAVGRRHATSELWDDLRSRRSGTERAGR